MPPSTPTKPTASAGWWSSIPSIRQRAGQAHRAWAAWRTKARRLSIAPGRPASSTTWATTTSARKFEHIYKFVSAEPWVQGGGYAANQDILDEGTLYAARFNADGTGDWIELTQGKNGLTAERGFPDAGRRPDRCAYCRRRGWARPTWIGPSGSQCIRRRKEVYVHAEQQHLARQGQAAAPERFPLGADAANPRAPNLMGHIVRWREDGGDPARHPLPLGRVPAGRRSDAWRPAQARQRRRRGRLRPARRPAHRRARRAVDPDRLVGAEHGKRRLGRHRQQPDAGGRSVHRRGAALPDRAGRLRGHRLAQFTPDLRTMFVNIQHPGEAPLPHPGRNDPTKPKAISSWPDGAGAGARARPPSPSAATTAVSSALERARAFPESLALLRRIDSGESDSVLSLRVGENGDRIAVGYANHAAFDERLSSGRGIEG